MPPPVGASWPPTVRLNPYVTPMITPLRSALGAILLGLSSCLALAAEPPEPTAAEREAQLKKLQEVVSSLEYKSGEVILGGGVAKANLPPTLRYLSPADTSKVLTDLWGNPRNNDTLGMLVPADFDPMADESWGVIISFEEDGYVKDDDASSINYVKLLTEMKKDLQEASKERVKQGYSSIELVGWAAPPHYDAKEKKLYWAKELQFGDNKEHTLNYNIRILGRRGVLVLNAVAGMNQLKLVETATPSLLAAVNFQEGHRYADFNAATDQTASYGIAALVAGGVAAKTGLLKSLWLAILAGKKLIIFALIGLAASAKRIIAWIKGREKSRIDEPAA